MATFVLGAGVGYVLGVLGDLTVDGATGLGVTPSVAARLLIQPDALGNDAVDINNGAGQTITVVDTDGHWTLFSVNPTDNMLGIAPLSGGRALLRLNGDGSVYFGDGVSAPDSGIARVSPAVIQATTGLGGGLGAFAQLVKAGVPSDADFASAPPDGTVVGDKTNNRLYIRLNGAWKYAALT